ncbi:MAG: HDIG domain-containing metalloprotein [Chloroflexia bacterium]
MSDALLAERPSDIFWRWAKDDLLRDKIPDVDALRGISQAPAHEDDAFVHTLKVVDAIAPTPVRRWAALLHDIGKAPTFIAAADGRSRFFEHDRIGAELVPEIMTGAGADPTMIEPVTRLVRLHMRPISYSPEWTDGAVRRLVEEAEEGRGPEGWADLIALARADLNGYLPEPIARGLWVLDSLEARHRSIVEGEKDEQRRAAREPASPLDGNELLALADRGPGPWVGELKSYLRDQVASGALGRDDKEQAAAVARAWLRSN